MKTINPIFRLAGMTWCILVAALFLTTAGWVSGQNANLAEIESVTVTGNADRFVPATPEMQAYGPALTAAETYTLGPLTATERAFIESKVDPPCVGVVRELVSPVTFSVKESEIPESGSVTVSGGRLSRIDADRVAWTIRIQSEQADRLRLFFPEGNIPPGVEVNLFGRDGAAFQQFDLNGVIGQDGFYTTTIFSDFLFLQFLIPVSAVESMHFRITSVVHSEEQYIRDAPLTCYEDANCAYANGYASIETLQNAIAVIFFVKGGGNYQCTGSLVNDVRTGDQQPFFLTANHCFDTQASATSLEAQFDYETLSCGGATNTNLIIVNGANMIAENSESDFTLVLLHEKPGGTRTLLGWTTGAVANNETLHSVHHPSAMTQKYSKVQNKTSPSYTCTGRSVDNFHYTTILGGQAWHGSSGAPVVRADTKIVGQMLGPCGDDSDICTFGNYYLNWGRFNVSYGNNNLQYWLNGGGSSVSMSSSPSVSHSFGTVNVGSYSTLTVTVNNTGTVPNFLNLEAGDVTITGANAGEFTLVGADFLYLDPGTSGTFTVRFYPSSPGMKTASFNIPHNADNITSPRVISLTGYGNPCSDIISLGGGGIANTKTFDVSGTGSWYTSTNNPCGATSEGVEQVYSFVAPRTGTYKVQVTSTNTTTVAYLWKSGSCASTGWTCIDEIGSAGTYGAMNWTAGTTYYLLLDDKFTSATTHTFYLYYDACESVTAIAGVGSGYPLTNLGGGNGVWFNTTLTPCGFTCPGLEQVYSFVPSVTGLYNVVVTAATGYVDYMYSTACGSGWTCIEDINMPGTYGSMLLTEGTTYYILLDDENTTAGTHTFYINLATAAGTWLGTVSSDWNNSANWSAGVIPTSGIDVTIPSGTPYQPVIGGAITAYTEDLLILAGAVLTQNSTSWLYVFGNFDSDVGQFIMNGTNAFLYFAGTTNTWWDDDNENDVYNNVRVDKDVSTASLTMSQDMTCSGTFEIREGVFIIAGTWILTITNTTTSAFEVEPGGKLVLTDESIVCEGDMNFLDGSQATLTGGLLDCGGDFNIQANATYDIVFDGGTLRMHGTGPVFLNYLDGLIFQPFNLVIDNPGGVCYLKSSDLQINGDLTIEAGTLSCANDPSPTVIHNIRIAGNWTNLAGTSGFNEHVGTVTFIGTAYQICSSETFANLVINKTLGLMRVSGGEVICAHYDYTAGGIQVLSGSFTANDLVDDGIFGIYYLYSGGTINLHNTGGLVDLHGFLYIYGGNFNVYSGGGIDSYWPWEENAGITMSGGVLDFKDNGVLVYNSATYTLASNITGGTIRTTGNFRSERADFNPTGGTVEFYGPSDCSFRAINGSNVFNVLINKGAYDHAVPAERMGIRDRETGEITDAPLANTVNLTGIADINGSVTIQNGILSAGSYTLNVAGNWNNMAGTAGFLEGTSTVEFDGAGAADILSAETFYHLNLYKTYAGIDGLEVMQLMACGGNLHLRDGTMKVNSPAHLDVSGNVTIELNAGLNVTAFSGQMVAVGGNWTNHNTTRSSTIGFWYGTSNVIFDGAADQLLSTAATEEMFYDLTVSKSAGEFKPNDDILSYGDVNVSSGIWEDNVINLHHTIYGDFSVLAAGGFYNAFPHNTVEFVGTQPSLITYLGPAGSFFDLLINKNMGVSVMQTTNVRSWYDGAVTINQGIYNLNGKELLLTGNLNVNTDGVLQLPAASTLIMTDARNINVNTGGRMELAGSPASKATVKANITTSRYGLNINPGGTIAAEHSLFQHMNVNGILINGGATIDVNHAFMNCTFQDGVAGGTLLQINNSQTVTIRNANFPINPGGGASNVTKTVNGGRVYFVDFTGGFSGTAYENDPNSRIDWVPTLTATTTATTNPICAGNSTQLNVIRTGGLTPYTFLWSPSTGLSNPNIINPLASPAVTTNYSVTVTDYLGTTATSSILVNVNPVLPVSVAITASSNPSPPGNFVSFTAAPVNGGTIPSFQWKVNGLNVGAGASSYAYVPVNGDQVQCILASNYPCPSGNPAASNVITMVVVPVNFSVTGNVPSPLNLCFDASNTLTVAGGGTTFAVQPGASVNLIAGQKIRILDGATVHPGGYLHGWITSNHHYCGSLPPPMVSVAVGSGTSPTGVQAGEALASVAEVPEATVSHFLLYPNPASHLFILRYQGEGEPGTTSVELFTMQGGRIFSMSLNNERSHRFDVSGYLPGFYFVKVTREGKTDSFKLVLTRP